MPRANNIVYLKFAKRVDLMLSFLTIIIIIKKAAGNFRGSGYVYGLGDGYGFKGMYLSPNSLSCIHYICAYFYMSIIPQ